MKIEKLTAEEFEVLLLAVYTKGINDAVPSSHPLTENEVWIRFKSAITELYNENSLKQPAMNPLPTPAMPEGMKWVKASERLPDEKKEVFIKNGQYKMIGYYENSVWYDDLQYPYLTQADLERNKIEWLDEGDAQKK
jgi:hypothetical protein